MVNKLSEENDRKLIEEILDRRPSPFEQLFLPGSSGHDDFCMEWFTRNLEAYAEAYFDCGKWLCEIVPERREPGGHHGIAIVFLFRHAIELALKHCVNRFYFLRKLNEPKFEVPKKSGSQEWHDHDLEGLLDILRREYRASRKYLDGVEFLSKQAQQFIKELNNIDPDSMGFRYPTSKSQTPLLDDQLRFHIEPLLCGVEHIFREVTWLASLVGITEEQLEEWYDYLDSL